MSTKRTMAFAPEVEDTGPVVVVKAKPRRRSKTYWANLLAIALIGAETQLHILQPLLPVSVFTLAAFTLPIINLVLREFTRGPVGK